jgi:hypothetical protein
MSPAVISTSFFGVSTPTSSNMACVDDVVETVSGVGLISSLEYLLSACFCPSEIWLARLLRRMADCAGAGANCGLLAARDPYCVAHWSVGVVRVKVAAGRGAARDLCARRDAPLRSMPLWSISYYSSRSI